MSIVVVSQTEELVARVRMLVADSELGPCVWMRPDLTDPAADLVEASTDLVVVADDVDLDDAMQIAYYIDSARPDICTIVMTSDNSDVWERAVRAGVRDIVAADATDGELRRTLERASTATLGRRGTKVEPEPEVVASSNVITIASPKGGVGRTTFATNLSLALVAEHPGQVVLVDLDLQFGDVAYALGLKPEATIDGALADDHTLSLTRLKAFLTPHRSGLLVVCAPAMPADADVIKPDLVSKAVQLLSERFRFVVVDTDAGMSEVTLSTVEESTMIVLLTTNETASIHAVRKQIETLGLIGFGDIERHIVLNRADARVALKREDIERTLGEAVSLELPSTRSVPLSLNFGSPLVESEPRSGYAKSVSRFAERWASPTQKRKRRIRSGEKAKS